VQVCNGENEDLGGGFICLKELSRIWLRQCPAEFGVFCFRQKNI
jgi:hypothetical protein